MVSPTVSWVFLHQWAVKITYPIDMATDQPDADNPPTGLSPGYSMLWHLLIKIHKMVRV